MNDNYSTPNWIRNMFPSFFDPCPLQATDGLDIEWGEWNYVNHPYSDPLSWVEKSIEEYKKGKVVVLLLKLDCSTTWYRKLVEADAHFLYIGERVKFNGKAPPFPNVMVVLS